MTILLKKEQNYFLTKFNLTVLILCVSGAVLSLIIGQTSFLNKTQTFLIKLRNCSLLLSLSYFYNEISDFLTSPVPPVHPANLRPLPGERLPRPGPTT